jgi:hypothetical protein
VKKTRHTPEQRVSKLRQAEARLPAGASEPEVARELWGSAKPPSTAGEIATEAYRPRP